MSDRAGIRAGEPSPAGGRAPDGLDVACRDVVELVSDYLDGALDPPLAAAVERHLALCPPCVERRRGWAPLPHRRPRILGSNGRLMVRDG